ncbi:MAG: hypothetical protein II967_00220, partial [Deltaproteobacteria bacterium]|nr:hypothetical protein [Deltaproteobacteria bacterium]
MNLEDFVIEHLHDDVSELLLHRSRWPGVDVALAADCIAARRKLRGKVPEWYADARLLFPSPLSAEQCSSRATARFKAQLALRAAEERAAMWMAGGQEAPSLIQGGFRDGGAENAVPSLIQGDFRDGVRIADLTGGLGVDSWQFAAAGATVLYNEMNPRLAEAAARNFALLGLTAPEGSDAGPGSGLRPSSLPSATGPSHSRCRGRHASPAPAPSGTARGSIECRCSEITPESLPTLLEDFRPDIVYLDPARRSSSGDKVFRLKDCSPDVLQLQDIILGLRTKPAVSSRSTKPNRPDPLMMLKLSPMADISQICRELHCVREIHCVESGGECKELLVMCEPGFCGEPTVFADVLTDAAGNPDEVAGAATGLRPGASFSFLSSEEAAAKTSPAGFASPAELVGKGLFEPGPALRKAGAFKLLACRFGLAAIGPDAHFYISDSTPETVGPFLETSQNRNHSPETAGPFLETSQNRNHSPETAGPFLETGQNRNHSPETAEPFLETGQNRNHSHETAGPFLETAQFRNHSPETAEPFLETGQNRNHSHETAGPFLETAQFRNH